MPTRMDRSTHSLALKCRNIGGTRDPDPASLAQHPADTPNRSTSAQPFQASNHVPPNQGPVWETLLRPDARWSTDSDSQRARRTRMWAGARCQSRVSVPPATMVAASDKEGLEWDGG